MNRDRFIAFVLAVLLLLSLAANWMLWKKSRGAGAPVSVAGPVGRTSAKTRDKGAAAKYEFVDNPAMKGRMGRIVISYAEGTELPPDLNRTVFYKEGTAELVHSSYGPVAQELLPASYDLEVNNKKLAGVPVKSGKDTRVPSGVLNLHGSKDTRFVIYDVGEKEKYLRVAYGNAVLGFPAGDYDIEVSGQREKFTIEPGKVTDY